MNGETDVAISSQLASAEQIERYAPGRTLFNEGEEPRGIFIIHSGEVDLVFSARNGLRKPLRTVRAGETLGLSDVVAQSRYDCTAVTRVPSRIGFVPLDDIRRMLDDDPSLWFGVAATLSAGMSSCWASIRSLSAHH